MVTGVKLQRGNGSTIHEQLKKLLVRELASYPLHARLPTDRELAKSLKVSFVTVNKAMNELCREGYVVRRQGKGTFLAAHEQQVFRETQSAPNGQLIVACPNYFSSEYWTRVHTTEEVAVKNGISCIELKLNPDTTWERLKQLAESQVNLRAVVVQPVPGSLTREVFDMLDSLGCPVVLCCACPFIAESRNCISVVADWFKIGYLKAKFLFDNGHRAIANISNEPPGQDGDLTLKGMRQAYVDYGLNPRSLILSPRDVRPWENSTEAGYRMTGTMLDNNRSTALIYDSIAGAYGGLRCLWERHLRVPDDFSMISTGSESVLEQFMSPPLTVVTSDYAAEVRRGLDLALNQGSPASRLVLMDPVIIERQSVRRISQ